MFPLNIKICRAKYSVNHNGLLCYTVQLYTYYMFIIHKICMFDVRSELKIKSRSLVWLFKVDLLTKRTALKGFIKKRRPLSVLYNNRPLGKLAIIFVLIYNRIFVHLFINI